MKNLSTLIIGLLLVNFNLNSQNLCQTAVTISSGTHPVTGISIGGPPPVPNCAENFGLANGAVWYRYQATVDGLATVSSGLPVNGNTDTRLTVYTGTCGNLTCIEGNDDIDGPTTKTSEASFSVNSGTFYYIVWDNSYSSSGFDFTLTETAVDCSSITLPITEDFDDFNSYVACLSTESVDANVTDFEQRFFDWNGDGSDEDYVSNGSTSTIAKNDWLFSTPIDLITGHEYTITFKYNGADGTNPANENLDVYFMDGASSTATSLTTLFNATGIIKNGTNQQAESMATIQSIDYTSTATGSYYLAFNGTSPANTGSLLLFEYSITENTLGVENFDMNGFNYTYDKESDILNLSSDNLPIKALDIYNTFGQKVLTQHLSQQSEQINLNILSQGIYLVQVTTLEKTFPFKILIH
jgi:hypothetical protein